MHGAAGGIRTRDHRLTRPALYRAELRRRVGGTPAYGLFYVRVFNSIVYLCSFPLYIWSRILCIGVDVLERVKLGIPVVDDVVEGFPRGSLIVFAGPPGIGKSVFIHHAVISMLKNGWRVLYIVFDDEPGDVIQSLGSFEANVSRYVDEGMLVFIDGFSVPISGLSESKWVKISPINPIDSLNTIHNVVRELENHNLGRLLIVVDSLNEVVLRNEAGLVLDFLKGLRGICKKYEAIGLVSLHTGIPGLEQLYFAVEYLSDGVVEFGFDPSLEQLGIPLRRLRVVKVKATSHSLEWIPYTILKDGKITMVDVKKIMSSVRQALSELQEFIGK